MITYGPEGTRCPGCADRERQLRALLRWIADNYRKTLEGKPVRDADECIAICMHEGENE